LTVIASSKKNSGANQYQLKTSFSHSDRADHQRDLDQHRLVHRGEADPSEGVRHEEADRHDERPELPERKDRVDARPHARGAARTNLVDVERSHPSVS
jgi:hypothetical protein